MAIRYLLIALILFSISACGFHLRGNYQLPAFMQETVLETKAPYGELARELKRALQSANVDLLDKVTEKSAVLKIIREDTGQRPLSIGADGRAQEYEIFYTVQFSLSHVSLEKDTIEDSFTLTRDYAFDPAGVLAAGGEEELLRKDMQRNLVRLIMQRLSAVTSVK